MAESALGDLRVLDVSEGVAGPYCTKLLADLGADVIKAERPNGGDLCRLEGPSLNGPAGPKPSPLFLYLNTNKRGITLDMASLESEELFRRLIVAVDVLVESYPPGYLESLDLGYDALRTINPRLVMVSITPFGQTGPYRNYEATDLTVFAMGGYMYPQGDPERQPLKGPGYQAQYQAGTQAAIALMAAVNHQRETGQGQYIDVSWQESMLSTHAWTTIRWSQQGQIMRRTGHGLIPCKDGFVHIFTLGRDTNVFILIERPELIDDPRLTGNADPDALRQRQALLQDLLADWAKDFTMAEICDRAQELRITASPVNRVADLFSAPQLLSRNWFVELDHPLAGRLKYPGPPFHLSETPHEYRLSAPLLGQHNAEVIDTLVTSTATEEPHRRAELSQTIEAPDHLHALQGIRVLEVTANWAGPLTGRLLADLGAEVIKIESPRRPAGRGGGGPGGDSTVVRGYNRGGQFNKLNRNKYDLTLDLNHPKGKESFKALAAVSDVVIENNSARVMANFGLDYRVLSGVNPRLIMMSTPGYGMTGPERDYVAYGSNIETTSGYASLLGYGDGHPFRTGGFYGDPVAGIHGAFAVLAALHARRKTGRGQFIDLSINESLISFMGEAVLEFELTRQNPRQLGNRHPRMAPHGCYRCSGQDQWVTIAVRDDEEWTRFCAAVGQHKWAERDAWSTVAGRLEEQDAIDALITGWTQARDHYEVMRLLQAAGVPSGPVLQNWEMLSDPHVYHRGFYVQVEHPETGVLPFPGMPWRLSATPASVRMPAPLFGQHNDEILTGLLGLSEDDVEVLEAEHVISRIPLPTIE